MEVSIVYKIVPKPIWSKAQREDIFHGAGLDLEDGYIHFSTDTQVKETASKHFAEQTDLVLVAIDVKTLERFLPGKLKFEPARGEELFPHLYAPLPLEVVLWARPLPWLESGEHGFPSLE